MVKLEEVEDEAFLADQLGAQEEENEWENTDDGNLELPCLPFPRSLSVH